MIKNNTQVDAASDLAGYTYEGSYGRHVTFFWQSVSDDYQAEPDYKTDAPANSPRWGAPHRQHKVSTGFVC